MGNTRVTNAGNGNIPETEIINTFGLIGDSRNDQQSISTIIANGVSRTFTGYSYFNWANALNNRKFNVIANFALSGSLSSALAGQISSILAMNRRPRFVIIYSGVNDLAASDTAVNIAANIISAANTLITNGMTPIIFLEAGSTSLTQTMVAQLNALNVRLETYARNTNGVILYDPRPVVWNPTSSATAVVFKTGYAPDGTHTATPGAYYLGKDFGTFIAGFLPKREPLAKAISDFNTTSNPLVLNANGLFTTTTGGTVTTIGVVGGNATPPSGWTITGAATSNANLSTEARADGVGNNVIIGVTTAGADTINLRNDTATAQRNAVSVGELMRSAVEVSVSGTLTNFCGIRVRHEYNDGSATHVCYDTYIDSTNGTIPEEFTAVLEPPDLVFSTAPTGWISTYLTIICSGAVSGLVVKFGRAITTRVPG
jgi:hypothetical protein